LDLLRWWRELLGARTTTASTYLSDAALQRIGRLRVVTAPLQSDCRLPTPRVMRLRSAAIFTTPWSVAASIGVDIEMQADELGKSCPDGKRPAPLRTLRGSIHYVPEIPASDGG